MTPRERLQAAVDGRPVDRVPYTAWRHFHLTPRAGVGSGLAEAEFQFYNSFEPDLLKVMHDIDYEPTPEIVTPDDWRSVRTLKPNVGNFGRQLDSLHVARWEMDPDVPIVATVFSVYHYANELSNGRLLTHLREAPSLVHIGLAAITESLRRYVREVISLGCEGIYYAVTGASTEGATHSEYVAPFKEFDKVVLNAAADAPFNILHLHGSRGLYFDIANDLPASILCWSDRTVTNPSLSDARRLYKGCIMGGIDENRIGEMTVEEITEQGRRAIAEAGERKFILAPGCSLPKNVSAEKLRGIAAAVQPALEVHAGQLAGFDLTENRI